MPGESNMVVVLFALAALASRAEGRWTYPGDARLDKRSLASRAEGRWTHPSDARLDKRYIFRDEDFAYEGDKGPDQWPTLFPECGGKAQSPVDIVVNEAQYVKFRKPFTIPDFQWAPSKVKVINNGHTVQVEPLDPATVKHRYLRGGPLNGAYSLEQLHFHWGPTDSQGSEHAIDGQYHAMEMHLVFSRNKERLHQTYYRAADDIAVLVVFMQLPRVVEVGSEVPTRDRFYTDGLVPCVCSGVLVYNGSLTSPPCSEAVTWLIFGKAIDVSSRQMAEFRKVKSSTGRLTSNRRPVQPLNNRTVYNSCSAPAFSRRRTRCGPLLVWLLALCCALYS